MKRLLSLLLLVFILNTAYTQSVDSMMQVYAQLYPQQKIHLHLDKPVYRAGETIWFKGYLFEGFSPAISSSNFYAEMIDANGKIIERKVYPIIEASAAGSFEIPPTWQATHITIRAYTTWMLNFDTAYVVQKPITILGRAGETESNVKKIQTDNTTRIAFFPEGGNLVTGLESVVAFKANDNAGLPIAVKGNITNSKGNVVTTFSSVHNGMGRMVLMPEAGETYTATWSDSTGIEKTTVLPAVRSEGVVLQVTLVNDRIIYKVARTESAPEQMQTLHLIAHVAQSPVYKAKVMLQTSSLTSGVMSVKKVPTGIIQLTLFNSNWEPLAERIVLINNDLHLLDANLSTPIVNTEKRSRNVIEIQVEDTLLTNMSVSVTDALIAQVPNEDNIVSRLLLTGDVKGYVHEPAYYFSKRSDSIAAHLDLVMLTHGWRKYNWSDVARKKTPRLFFQPDAPLQLQAKVFGLPNGLRLNEDEQVFAIIEGKDSSKSVILIPKVGADLFATRINFFDTVKVYYQFQKNRKLETTASILLQNNFAKGKPLVNPATLPFYIPPSMVTLDRAKLLATELSKYKSDFNVKGNVLETVTVRTKVKSRLDQLDEKYASGLFSGDAQSFDMTDGNNSLAMNIFQFLQGRVAGVMVNDPMGNPSVTWRGSQTSLFLDEMPVDAQTLSTINVNDIAYIKVFRPPFMAASGGGAGGGIAVYTKKGSDAPKSPAGVGLSRSTVVGYANNKEFYSPNYSDRAASADVTADYRTTLYWQPFIFTDANTNKVKIQFYNNDISKAFRIVLEGVNEIGKIIRIEKVVTK